MRTPARSIRSLRSRAQLEEDSESEDPRDTDSLLSGHDYESVSEYDLDDYEDYDTDTDYYETPHRVRRSTNKKSRSAQSLLSQRKRVSSNSSSKQSDSDSDDGDTSHNKSSGLLNWFRSKFRPKTEAPVAYLGEKNEYYFDRETQTWKLHSDASSSESKKSRYVSYCFIS